MRPAPGRLAMACLLAGACLQVSANGIYTCVDAQGRRLTSDRPIPECVDRPQDLRNSDGSIRTRLPPTPTAEERTAIEETQRRQMVLEAARRDAVRHDRNLLTRFPDEAAHRRSREAALDPLRLALKNIEKRLAELQAERRAIEAEMEFYPGKDLPRRLRARQDENLTSMAAQQAAAANHQAEVARINARYDDELARLRRLWNGALPGSLGPAPGTASATR